MIHWRRDRLPTPAFLGFPCGSVCKEFAYNEGSLGSIPGLGSSPGEGNSSYPLQYSGLENSMNCTVHGVAKSWTQLSNFHSHIGSWVLISHQVWDAFDICFSVDIVSWTSSFTCSPDFPLTMGFLAVLMTLNIDIYIFILKCKILFIYYIYVFWTEA